jgi:hypothetical protein
VCDVPDPVLQRAYAFLCISYTFFVESYQKITDCKCQLWLYIISKYIFQALKQTTVIWGGKGSDAVAVVGAWKVLYGRLTLVIDAV